MMRLMQSRLSKLTMLAPKDEPSSYIGTETTYIEAGEIPAEVQPLSDTMTAEHYGLRISRSVQLFTGPDTHIMERYRFDYNGDRYEVKGVSRYPDHAKVVAEKI